MGRYATRRRFCVQAVTLQVLTLLAMSALLATGLLSLPLLIAGICLYQISGQAAGTAWSSWYGDLVPAATRGRWFARRNRVVYLSTCAGLALAGGMLHLIEPNGVTGERSRIGFAILFALAALARILSASFLGRSPEPTFRGLPRSGEVLRFFRTDRGNQALRILLLGALFHFTVYWSSPYFTPFMLEDLRFSYAQYMAAALCVIVAKALLTSVWGHLIDRQGAKLVFLISMLCVAMVPLPWFFANGLGAVILAQVFSGISWSGYEVGYFSLLLEKSTRKTRPFVFASQSVANGLAQLAGVILASTLIFPRVDGYREVFLISMTGRLAITIGAPVMLLGIRRAPAAVWSRMGLRLYGLRSNGGFSMRPVLLVEEEPLGDDPTGSESAQRAMD
jgi:MFS family permease